MTRILQEGAAEDGFEGYATQTEATPVTLLTISGVVVALALFYVAFYVFCLPSWQNRKQQGELLTVRQSQLNGGGNNGDHEVPSDGTSETANHQTSSSVDREERLSLIRPSSDRQPQTEPMTTTTTTTTTSTTILPDRSAQSLLANFPHDAAALQAPSTTDRASAVPSTTSSSRRRRQQLRPTALEQPLRSWDLGQMRWKHRSLLSRAQTMHRSVQNERQIQVSSEDGGSNASRSRSSWNSRPGSRLHSHRGVSDVASNILEQGNMEGEAQFYRQRYMERNQRRRRGPMSSASSARSFIGALSPDAISPDMAADAHDPGTLNIGYTNGYYSGSTTGGGDDCLNCCAPVGNLLDYSDLDFETRRILTLTFPATIEAAMDPLFRLGVVVLISNFLDTNSMVAFVLVSLLLRTSAEEVAGALVDAQSSLLQEAIAEGGNMSFLMAGRTVQLGIHVQFLIMVPILGIWAVFMEDVVSWLVPENPGIAQVAADYAQIIVVEFYIKALSRSFMLLFHLTGQAQFELNVDLTMYAITIAVIAIASSVSDGISVEGIAWIQVMATAISALGKIAYILRKGLVKPYQEGLLGGFALLDMRKVRIYFTVLLPLLLGSLIEVGEWQVLILFVQHLGGAEVATWAMMGILWEICEAFTEGLGEGAAVRVSYYLTENLPDLAKQLANKAVFLSMVESTILTAIFLMIGPNLSVALTRDAVLQNLFNDLVPMIALANLSMSLAQIYWSLVGAQGYFSPASAVILAIRWLFIVPTACALIYSNAYDLLSVVSCVSMGYAIGSVLLARMIFRSDWAAVAAEHGDDAAEMDGVQMEFDEADDEEESESEDDSSTGFGM